MKHSPVQFSSYLSHRLRNYRVLLPLLVSLVSGVWTAGLALYMLIRTDSAVLGSVAPHIAVLIETNDMFELQRFISTMDRFGGGQIEVIFKGNVIASTKSRADIGVKKVNKQVFEILPCLQGKTHMGRAPVARPGGPNLGAEVRMYTPLLPIASAVLGVMVVTFLFSWAIVAFAASRISQVARESLKPLERLSAEIRSLGRREEGVEIEPFEIEELETIRTTTVQALSELAQATHELAEAKAKELSEQAYKRLIHDLHTPVAALRQCVKASSNDRLSEEKRTEARVYVAELAEQILRQVGAGKNNLATTLQLKKSADLRTSIVNAVTHARLATRDTFGADIHETLPIEPVLLDHDPLMIGRVVSNLITNAVEARSRKVQVVVDMLEDRPRIKVCDDGPGMTSEAVALHLTGRGRSSKADRSGYGLSSCNHIVRSHGGRIVYRRSSVGGSEFEIRM